MDDTTASVAQAPPVPKKRGRPKKVAAVDGSASVSATEGAKKVVGKTSAAATKAKKTATPNKEKDEAVKKVGKPAPVVKRATKVVKSVKDEPKVVVEKVEKVVVPQSKILDEVEKKGTLKAAVAAKSAPKIAPSERVSEAPLLQKAKASASESAPPKVDVASQSKGLPQEPTPMMASAIKSTSNPTASPAVVPTVSPSSKPASKPPSSVPTPTSQPPPVASSSPSKSTPTLATASASKTTQNPAASPIIASVASASSKSTPNPQFSIPKPTSRPPPPGTPSSPSKPPSPPSAPRQPPPPKPAQPHPRATTIPLPRTPHNPYLSRPAPQRPKPLTLEEIEKREAEQARREFRLPKKYQRVGNHINRIIVGIPFIIVGGWVLYQRLDEIKGWKEEWKNVTITTIDPKPTSSRPSSSP